MITCLAVIFVWPSHMGVARRVGWIPWDLLDSSIGGVEEALTNMAEQVKLTRIAIVNNDRCKPKKCRQECKKSCPVVRMGELPG